MPIQSLAIVQVLKAFMACINNNNNDDFVVVFCETLQCCSTVCSRPYRAYKYPQFSKRVRVTDKRLFLAVKCAGLHIKTQPSQRTQ